MQLIPDKKVDDTLWYYKGYEDFKSRIRYGISERQYLEEKKDIFDLLGVSSVLSIGPGRIGYLFNRDLFFKIRRGKYHSLLFTIVCSNVVRITQSILC